MRETDSLESPGYDYILTSECRSGESRAVAGVDATALNTNTKIKLFYKLVLDKKVHIRRILSKLSNASSKVKPSNGSKLAHSHSHVPAENTSAFWGLTVKVAEGSACGFLKLTSVYTLCRKNTRTDLYGIRQEEVYDYLTVSG